MIPLQEDEKRRTGRVSRCDELDDHALLKLMQREWERFAAVEEGWWSGPPEKQPAPKMIIVILFGTLFEHVMDRFFAVAVHTLPPGVGKDLLRRYQGIGARMDRLYRMLFRSGTVMFAITS